MEHDPHETVSTPEHDEIRALEALPEALGYVETDDLTELADALIEAMRSGAETRDLALRYMEQAEVVADQSSDERARLGLEIRLAGLRRAGGRTEAYLEDIEAAYVHALEIGLDDVAAILEAELP